MLAPLTTLPAASRYMLGVAASGAFSRKSRKVLRPSASWMRHEAAAAEVARRRIDDRQRVAHRDRGIDRIAAAPAARRRRPRSRGAAPSTTMPCSAATGATEAAQTAPAKPVEAIASAALHTSDHDLAADRRSLMRPLLVSESDAPERRCAATVSRAAPARGVQPCTSCYEIAADRGVCSQTRRGRPA